MNSITAMTLTNGTLTIIIDNGSQILTARSDHPKWNEIKTAYRNNDTKSIINLVSLKTVIEQYSVGKLSVTTAGVTYNGRPLHSIDTQRIMAFLKDGLPYEPIANYMARKMLNPSARAIEEMYKFLENKYMPITPEGMIIAYKGVKDDYYSVNGNLNTVVIQGIVDAKGRILNKVGETIEIERSSCDDDFRVGCSYGLHAGSLNYALKWSTKVVLVLIDPKDVVSVPSDDNCQKLRCCKYIVIGEYTGALPSHYTDEYSTNIPKSNTNTSTITNKEVNNNPSTTETNTASAHTIDNKFLTYKNLIINGLCKLLNFKSNMYSFYDMNELSTLSGKKMSSNFLNSIENGLRTYLSEELKTGICINTFIDIKANTTIQDIVNRIQYMEHWKQGYADTIANGKKTYYHIGDEIAADSPQHKQYILGCLCASYYNKK